MPKYHYLFTIDAPDVFAASGLMVELVQKGNSDASFEVSATHVDGDGLYHVEGTLHLRCPDNNRFPDKPDTDIIGCGYVWEGELDEDGWVDCPKCGICFDPHDPANQVKGI